ncbi:MAG: glycine--tRNA ligase subunit beta [Pseudomonadota bacterium]
MPDLMIELFSEEIPARMQARASEDLKSLVTNGLVEAGLTYASAGAFATPRRLALSVEGLSEGSKAVREERKGPRTDAPDKAIEGFLRSTGMSREQLETRDDKKGQVYFAVIEKPGRKAAEIIAEVLEATVRAFPWPKSMRWGSGSLRWVRPLRRILCILSDEAGATVVPLEIDGIEAGDVTEGHRFMAPGTLQVTGFDDYTAKLKRAFVMLDPSERAEAIRHDAETLAFAQGLEVVEDRSLLTEVAGLVEWPVTLMGEIAEDYLDLPPEVLKTSMKEHQKFFSVRDRTGKITRFITVANRETADNGATILAGNSRVLSARLADAKFFWENDLRVAKGDKMQPWLDALANVTFHNKLGSEADRIGRIAALARQIAPMVGANPDVAEAASRVAKADLASEMVYEFPELQGIMGRYYAQAAGMEADIAAACAEHYAPLGPSDEVPQTPVSVAVSLAEKIDKLAGFWAIDEKPTGSKDPFALRRAALGVVRLVLENDLRLHLDRLIDAQILRLRLGADGEKAALLDTVAAHGFHAELDAHIARIGASGEAWKKAAAASGAGDISDTLISFFHDRLKTHLRDEGIPHDVIDAVLAMPNRDDLTLVVRRARALASTLQTEDGENLVQGFKRANNILRQAEEKDGVAYEFGPDRKFAEDPSEIALFDALDAAEGPIARAMETDDFETAMTAMAGLRAPVDAFFETVQVNSENEIVRRNRLNLLHRITIICGQVADLTRLSG